MKSKNKSYVEEGNENKWIAGKTRSNNQKKWMNDGR